MKRQLIDRINREILQSIILAYVLASFIPLNNCRKEEKDLPVLVTIPAISIKATSALVGGQISNDGGTGITVRGVCWGTEPNPDISCSKSTNGRGKGTFTCTLAGLRPNTLYCSRAFATNSKGTAYGGEIRFTTNSAKAPVVITIVNPSSISYFQAIAGGEVTDDGGAPVTEKGICWSTNEDPTISNSNKVPFNENNNSDFSTFWCPTGPLQPKSVYHVRAYAINAIGISYGNDMLITTLALPEVKTFPAIKITTNAAIIIGNVTSLGDVKNDIEAGICYGTDKDPTFEGPHINSGRNSIGEFECILEDLEPGTLYYARAYVHLVVEQYLDAPTVYGNEITFITSK